MAGLRIHKNTKAALLRRLNGLRKEAGIRTGKIGPVVFALSGKRMRKDKCYEWIAEQSGIKLEYRINSFGEETREVVMERDFYSSLEWKQLRYQVLFESNGCCRACGRSNRKHGVILHVDHIKPRSRFPKLELEKSNLQVLCEDCNYGKGNRDEVDWSRGRLLF